VPDIEHHSAQLPVSGEFSLRAASTFAFGPTEGTGPSARDRLRLAFPVDGGRGYAGAVLRQDTEPHGPITVDLTLRDGAEAKVALAQVARIVSLDHDGSGFLEIGRADPVLGELQRAHRGQRPVLFGSPYEAAAWAVISSRRPAARGKRVRDELSVQFGDTFELEGETLHAFPQPVHLLELGDRFDGLNLEKLTRLRGVAGAAFDGDLDARMLHALGPERAFDELQRLDGIGPFYAGLIVVRATGFADALVPMPEPKLLAHAAHYYACSEEPTLQWLTDLAQRWRPFRTWATVLIRLAGARGTPAGASGAPGNESTG
jgi:DNA-3-methyladenine glycosylase II